MKYKHLHKKIDNWYRKYGRLALPWRNTEDPYKIYVSEVMLQQTQVKTVLDRFYFQFLAKFPSLEILANADLESVLKAWEGLGYYSRARNLHKCAAIVAPTLPDDFEGLQELPGIGKNTAAAICAFAFKQPIPVMEANLKRVLSRFFGLEIPKDKELWDAAYLLLDNDNPYDYNQAMMDIGSMVCVPKAPKCDLCPLQSDCKGKKEPEKYGLKKTKKVPTRHKKIFIWHQQESIYLIKRKERFLNGMYGFPEFFIEDINPDLLSEQVLGTVIQKYSHFTLDAEIYYTAHPEISECFGGNWYSTEEIKSLPMSEVDKKIVRLFEKHTSTHKLEPECI